MNNLEAIQEAMDTIQKARALSMSNQVIWEKLNRIHKYLTKVYGETFAAQFAE